MALFPTNADDALRAAIGMMNKLRRYNEERLAEEKDEINIGIGIHSGTLTLGTIGEEERMEGTVISDSVNLASRMEGLCKTYGASVAISGPTLFQLDDPSEFSYRFLGIVLVKGKREPVSVFELLDAAGAEEREQKEATRYEFEKAINMYLSEEFEKARNLLAKILERFDDMAVRHVYDRCEYYLKNGVPLEWMDIRIATNR